MTEKNVVILCKCRGHVAESLPLDEIGRFLRRRLPDLEVTVADDLCQPGVLRRCTEEWRLRPWVVGACPRLEQKRHVWRQAEGPDYDSHSIGIVDVLKEVRAPLRTSEIADRVKLLLWAQVERRREFRGIPRDKLKLHFSRPEGKMSRRDLLMLALPQYEVIPFIEPARCRGQQGCRLCVDTCPLKAIRVEEGRVLIDITICNGCGACTAACPHRAVVYPTFSIEELDREMEGLLLPKEVALESRIIAAVCQKCLPESRGEGAEPLTYPPNVLPLKVPCLALVSPWLILRAFDMGAQGFALISGRGRCRSGFDSARWREGIRFVQGLFDCWNVEPERVGVFEVDEDTSCPVGAELGRFADEVSRLAPTPLGMSEPALVPGEGLVLPLLLKDIRNRLGSPSGAVSQGAVPFGKLELEGSKCTGCGLCALECTTGALSVSSGKETDCFQLLFRHDDCVACGRCVEVCPEKCLRLERILELDRIDSPSTVLFEDRILRCHQCGSPVAPKAMIDKLRAELSGSGASLSAQFELCPPCRTRLSLGRATTEQVTAVG